MGRWCGDMPAHEIRPAGLGDLASSLANAIAQFEGYNVAGSVAQRNNNPGNLRSGPGQTGTDASGYAIFPDASTGFAALDNQISLNVSRGLSLETFIGGGATSSGGTYPGYAPSGDNNNVQNYVTFLANELQIDPSTPLNQIGASPGSFRRVPPRLSLAAEHQAPRGTEPPSTSPA